MIKKRRKRKKRPQEEDHVKEKERKKRRRRMPVLLLLAGLVFAGAGAAEWTAQEVHAAETRTGNIQITYTCDSGKTAVSGAEFSAVPVAYGEKKQEGWVFTLRQEYQNQPGIPDPGRPEFWNSTGLADRIFSCRKKRDGTAAETGVTDAEGRLSLTECPAGIYLVWQSGSTGESQNYETAQPFLISIPAREQRLDSQKNTKETAKENTESRAYPKTAKKPGEIWKTGSSVPTKLLEEEPEPDRIWTGLSPRGQGTGDSSQAYLLLLISVLSMSGLIAWIIRKHRREDSGQ